MATSKGDQHCFDQDSDFEHDHEPELAANLTIYLKEPRVSDDGHDPELDLARELGKRFPPHLL